VVVFKQLLELGIAPNRLFIGIFQDDGRIMEAWATNEDGTKIESQFDFNVNDNRSMKKMRDGWKQGKRSIVIDMKGKELEDYFTYLQEELKVPFQKGLSEKRRVQTIAYFSQGLIGMASSEEQPEETTLLLERFAAVFNLTYARFNDLQVAEAQTKKANLEVALERVRARALAMQEPEELIEVAQVMRHEMGLLGMEALETSSIYINGDDNKTAECWYALKDIRKGRKKLVSDQFRLTYKDTWVGRRMFEFYHTGDERVSIPMKGVQRKEWIEYCSEHSIKFRGYYGKEIPERTYHLYKFSNGSVAAATRGEISEESWELLRRTAGVFSLAYSRFKDLSKARQDLQRLKAEKRRAEEALKELKATQSQLIQSEKMASLGELTAGIAHEIQNPLNFVNNFSEVSHELLLEMMEELQSGDLELVREISTDIGQNLEKINHHGKRASDIVKGMLQHSRSSGTVKEMTDINKLADEYLRLAYHGLRAKDKSFNAKMETSFEENLEKIDVIPQEIGRVLLNLITNAFYAVNEKKNSGLENYEPMVLVGTKSRKKIIEIVVRDNGNGIPPKVIDKIFQPFFTTKPTGSGTGLGLSLSYDIVKAHGGELKVETRENEGTEFTMELPK
jgi:signal transduction histidine kinase